MTALMLTPEEIERLTGRKRPTAQQAWLRRNGIRFRINDCGEVIVARAIAERFLGAAPAAAVDESDLDWPAMQRVGIVSHRGEA